MRAVRVSANGLGIADVPVPEPGPGQVLVRVAGAGLCSSRRCAGATWGSRRRGILRRYPITASCPTSVAKAVAEAEDGILGEQ